MYRKSLEIHEALGRKEGIASSYGNLGIVYQIVRRSRAWKSHVPQSP